MRHDAWRNARLPWPVRRFLVLTLSFGPTRVLSVVILTLCALAASSLGFAQVGQPPNGKATPAKAGPPPVIKKAPAKNEPKSAPAVKFGLSVNDPRAFQGYTMFSPIDSSTTYLIDMQGKVVRTWESDCTPALCPYFLENGHLLRPGSIGNDSRIFGPGPGVGGRIQEFTWDGELVWDFRFYNARQLPHHDMTRLPNGNVLLVVSDRKTNEEILAAGRRPELAGESHSIPDSLIEIRPTGKSTGEVVWEWHLWDHLVQDFDKTKANYGNVAQHPELVNVNYGEDDLPPVPAVKAGAKPQAKTKAGAPPPPKRPARGNSDWTHFNAVAYNAELNQIVVSVYAMSEFWIIDHGTTTAEASGHKGGRGGKGGDLLYRWGNPRAHRAGKKADQKLFNQHNVHWIPKGFPGEGHLLLFNNGNGRSDGSYSSVDELILPADPQGRYARTPGGSFVAPQLIWSYSAPKKSDFYSSFISGAQRLPNGDTLICSGANGTIFEVSPAKEIVWKYVNPVRRGSAPIGPPVPAGKIMTSIARHMLYVSSEQGRQLDYIQKDVDAELQKLLTVDQRKQLADRSQAPFSKPGEIVASADQNRLKLTEEQKKKLAALQKDVDQKFDKVLTPAQKKQLQTASTMGGPGPGIPPPISNFLSRIKNAFVPGGSSPAPGASEPGKILSPAQQDTLKLSPDQRKRLAEIQKETDAKLDKLLTQDQKKQLVLMQKSSAPAVAADGPGRGSPPGGPPVFRAYRFGPNHPGLIGKKLTPGKTIEELQQTAEKKEVAKKK
jgi:Spy/CpxP family protein refolding chaperone